MFYSYNQQNGPILLLKHGFEQSTTLHTNCNKPKVIIFFKKLNDLHNLVYFKLQPAQMEIRGNVKLDSLGSSEPMNFQSDQLEFVQSSKFL